MKTPAREVWLESNHRALAGTLVVPGGMLLAGLVMAAAAEALWIRILGGLLVTLGGMAAATLAWQWRLPRLARAGSELWVYLGTRRPERVPLAAVECFFLGRGPADVPGQGSAEVEASTVVVRLAEQATNYAQRDVLPRLGRWCGGYITIRGAWCEPLNLARVNQLNERLRQAQAEAGREEAIP